MDGERFSEKQEVLTWILQPAPRAGRAFQGERAIPHHKEKGPSERPQLRLNPLAPPSLMLPQTDGSAFPHAPPPSVLLHPHSEGPFAQNVLPSLLW